MKIQQYLKQRMPCRAKRSLWTLALALCVALCLSAAPARAVTKVDVPTSNVFDSGGVTYAGLEFLLHIPGTGNIWVAIPYNHDLEAGPEEILLVCEPSESNPVTETEERPSIRELRDEMDTLRHDPNIGLRPMQPYIGEIRMFAGNYAPPGWTICDGRLLALVYYPELFEVIGNTYGGDGRMTLGLPDLRGRAPMGNGAGPGLTNREIGQEVGTENTTLGVENLPPHSHQLRGTNSGATQTQPEGNILAQAASSQYVNASVSVNMGSGSIGATGSGTPVPVVQPSTVVNFIIATHANYARPRFPSASKWPVLPGEAPPRWPIKDASVGSGITVDPDTDYPWVGRLEIFTSGGVDYRGLDIIEHEDGIGTIWVAIPYNHDLSASPEELRIVLNPDVGEGTVGDGRSTIGLEGFFLPPPNDHIYRLFAISQVMLDYGLGGWNQGVEFNYTRKPDDLKVTRFDTHSGLEFTSGGVDYLGIEMLEVEEGIGTIWAAIPRNHDLETGPVNPLIVLAPDVVTPN